MGIFFCFGKSGAQSAEPIVVSIRLLKIREFFFLHRIRFPFRFSSRSFVFVFSLNHAFLLVS